MLHCFFGRKNSLAKVFSRSTSRNYIIRRGVKLNFKEWQEDLNKLLEGKSYKIIFEPGRYIVADSCELISKVLYVKKSGNKKKQRNTTNLATVVM